MPTGYHIQLRGITQGVGFRPYVYRLARRAGLRGRVRNTPAGLQVDLICDAATAKVFCERLLAEPPAGAYLNAHRVTAVSLPDYPDFRIDSSPVTGPATVLPPPDVALCPHCRAELRDPANRRHGYAFITCTYCGPRYSLIDQLPYDRERTAMASYTMCRACASEYNTPADRRFHSQTNSCRECGPQLTLVVAQKERTTEDPIAQAVDWLRAGRIGAVKGLGGYLLFCDATNAEAIRELRRRKQRPTKPLALLYADLERVAGDTLLHPPAATALEGPVGPIVLLSPRPDPVHPLPLAEIAPGLGEIGVMLPAAPLLDLLSTGVGRPLVATSGNLSGSPIISTAERAESALAEVADFFLHHDRDIHQPQDDSVLRFTPDGQRPVWLRRARGLAPLWKPECTGQGEEPSVLTLGSDLKHTYCFRAGGNTYLSQYLGDLASYDSQEAAANSLRQLTELIGARPQTVVTDAHPAFHSHREGAALGRTLGAELQTVQHHRAHLAAVLAERNRWADREEILGVIWDGTGYGDDGQVWGGEFMAYRGLVIERMAHLRYFPSLLGDKMSREPRLSALSLWREDPETLDHLEAHFTSREWKLYNALAHRNDQLQSSSMGRVFDAVAMLLGVGNEVSYAGEAAARLEWLARDYVRRNGWEALANPPWPVTDYLDTGDWLSLLARAHRSGRSAGWIAAGFHRQLIELIRVTAEGLGYRKIACSGGVWQNTLLIDLLDRFLADSFELILHRDLSPNDENISYGQLQLVTRRRGAERSLHHEKSLSNVSGNSW